MQRLCDRETCEPIAGAPGEAPETGLPRPVFDEQFGIRIGSKKYYVNLRIGAEQRSTHRVDSEGQVPLATAPVLYCVIGGGVTMLFGTLCMLYLLKSGAGIDLFDGHSILHPLFALAVVE